MNSYSYAGDNPISQLDASGDAFYYFADGHMEFHGTTNYVHTEAGDNQYFARNAAQMESLAGTPQSFTAFYSHVHTGGDWDYKDVKNGWESDGFIFDGKWYNAANSGNLDYGYTSAAAGIGPGFLQDAAVIFPSARIRIVE